MEESFLAYMEYERNASKCTLRNCKGDLKRFREFLCSKGLFEDWSVIDADHVRLWMEQMMDDGIVPATVNQRLSSLRSFFKFALKRGFVHKNPMTLIQGLKTPKKLPVFVREAEMDDLLDSSAWDDSFASVRDRLVLQALYEAGLRRSELVGLDDADVDFSSMQLKVTGKRNKQRLIPFGDSLKMAMMDYLEMRDKTLDRNTTAFFVSNRGARISVSCVYNIVRRNLALVTTQKKKSPHVLRHSFATAMLNNDAGLESVQKLLGHTSLNATEVYTHVTFEQLKRVYDVAHPRMDEE